MRLIFGLVVVRKCRKRPKHYVEQGIRWVFSAFFFLRRSVEANGSCRLEYSLQTSGILLFVVS